MTYKVQIDDILRDATQAETEAIDAVKAEVEAQAEAQAEKAVARAALLTKIGITADEAKLLLG